jgi:predicted nucleic acid-binding Zn ribbon protein
MERLGENAGRLLAAAGAPRVDELAAVVGAWPTAVGETVARNAWPQRIARDGTLHVATTSATWAFELGRLADDVLARLRAALGTEVPAALRFAPGPVPEPSAPAPESRAERPRPGPAERHAAAVAAAPIGDPELRELVARAAAASLARATADQLVW